MILSAIILSLLSLLVATDPELTGSSTPPPGPPLRPVRKPSPDRKQNPPSDQIAA